MDRIDDNNLVHRLTLQCQIHIVYAWQRLKLIVTDHEERERDNGLF